MFDCNDCDSGRMDEDEAFAHSREFHHCVGERGGRIEAFCYREDH